MSSEAPRLPRAIAADGDPAWAGTRRLALKVDFAIGTLAEAFGAALVLAEIGILFAGVVSRYVFNSPLMWTDELANFLFLWLAMLGAVVAFRRDGHMRLTTFVNSLEPRARPMAGDRRRPGHHRLRPRDPGAGGPISAGPAIDDVDHPAVLRRLPRARDPGRLDPAWRSSPCLRLLETTTAGAASAFAVAVVGAVALGLWLAQPLLIAMGNGSLVLFFVVLVAVCVIIGVPIAFTFGIATFSYLALTTSLPLSIVVNRIDDGISNLLLLAVPMFVFLGLLMEMTGIARVMVNFLAAMIGHVKGGLTTCCSARCTWFPGSPDRRPPTWRRWRRSCFPRCGGAAPIRASSPRCSRPRARCPRRSRRASC